MASSGNQFKIWSARAAGVSSGFTVTGSGSGDTYFSTAPPLVADTTVWRSFQPTAEEADIGLAEECGPYRSPPADSWIVSGPDYADFEPASNAGYIRFTSACRTGGVRKNRVVYITPYRTGVGYGATATLTVAMTTNASDEFFVSYSTGINTGVQGTFASPYKYLPGSADYGGTARAPFTSDQVVFYKGERHYTTAWASKTNLTSTGLSHGGNSTKPFVVEFNGWGAGPGGRGGLDGSVQAAGSGASVTQVDVAGNTNYANITRYTGQTYIESFQLIYCGANHSSTSQLYEAAWPTPTDIRVHSRVDYVSAVGSELYGSRNYPVQTSGGTRRIYTNGASAGAAGTTLTVVDPDFAALFSAFSQATLVATGMTCTARRSDNFWSSGTLTGWNGTDTLTFSYTSDLSTADGFGSLGLRNHPLFITKAGQVYTDPARTQFDAWLPSASTVYISRLYGAIPWRSGDYITWRGGFFERFCNGTLSGGSVKDCGIAYWFGSSGTSTEAHLINGWYRQNNCSNGSFGVIHIAGAAAAGLNVSNCMLNYFEECNESSGFRFSGMFNGTTGSGGVEATMRSNPGGKIAYNSMGDEGCGQTWCYFSNGDGIHIHHNIVIHHHTLHGNGYSPYDFSTSAYIINLLVEYNTHVDSARFYTWIVQSTGDHAHIIRRNLVAGPDNYGAAFQANGPSDGTRIRNNLLLGYASGYSWGYIIQFGAGGANMDISGNVMAGSNTSQGSSWTGSITGNVVTIQSGSGSNAFPPASSLGGTYSTNKQYTGTPDALRPYWDGTFTADDLAYIGAGGIGALHTLA